MPIAERALTTSLGGTSPVVLRQKAVRSEMGYMAGALPWEGAGGREGTGACEQAGCDGRGQGQGRRRGEERGGCESRAGSKVAKLMGGLWCPRSGFQSAPDRDGRTLFQIWGYQPAAPPSDARPARPLSSLPSVRSPRAMPNPSLARQLAPPTQLWQAVAVATSSGFLPSVLRITLRVCPARFPPRH